MKKEVKEFCKKIKITKNQFLGKEKISSLYLSSLTSIPEGFNPTVGGYLDLRSLTSIPEGFNPTVGGYLYLSSLTSIPEGFNPTVGGYLDFKGNSKTIRSKVKKNFFWKKYSKEFALIDGLFCEITSKKYFNGITIYQSRKINKTETFFIAEQSEIFSHGKTTKEAIEDLQFKINVEKLKSEPINPESIISIERYRAITGACREGVNQWISQNNIKVTQMKASKLLIKLKKTNAYGVEKFERLLNN